MLGLALLAPSLLFLALFTYWPVAQVLRQSLHEESRRAVRFVGLRNYEFLFADPSFQKALATPPLRRRTVGPSLVLALALNRSTRVNAAACAPSCSCPC
jgi:sn-glycerol 3-phosphate transport system permease protein